MEVVVGQPPLYWHPSTMVWSIPRLWRVVVMCLWAGVVCMRAGLPEPHRACYCWFRRPCAHVGATVLRGGGPGRRPRVAADKRGEGQSAARESPDSSHDSTGPEPGSGGSPGVSDGLEELMASGEPSAARFSQFDFAAPNDETAMMRQAALLARRGRADSDADDANQLDPYDSWLVDIDNDEGPHARDVSQRRGTEEPERPPADGAGASLPLRHGAGARFCSDSEGDVGEDMGEDVGEDVGEEEGEEEREDSGDWDLPVRGEIWSESEDAQVLLSPVSRFRHKLQKLKWQWYDEDERKPDADGWTELDRHLRRNVAAPLVCRPPLLIALGGFVH
jgi:hypothetical protein